MARAVTAVVPAAGLATRLGPTLSGSKEVLEIGGRPVLSHFLARLAAAEIPRAIVALRHGKWDITAALTGDARHGVDVAFTVVADSPSPAHSIAPALEFAADDIIALGFPDVLFEPRDAFAPMLERLTSTRAELVLGVFPSSTPDRVDMVQLDRERRVTGVVIKQPDRGLTHCWTLAVWRPSFTELLLNRVRADATAEAAQAEFQIGDVIHGAITSGVAVESVIFDEGTYLDIGTPADLDTARRSPHLFS